MKKVVSDLLFLKEKLYNGIFRDRLNCIDKAIETIVKIDKIKEILNKRDNAFDGQEFGASYGDLDSIIEEIREVINS